MGLESPNRDCQVRPARLVSVSRFADRSHSRWPTTGRFSAPPLPSPSVRRSTFLTPSCANTSRSALDLVVGRPSSARESKAM